MTIGFTCLLEIFLNTSWSTAAPSTLPLQRFLEITWWFTEQFTACHGLPLVYSGHVHSTADPHLAYLYERPAQRFAMIGLHYDVLCKKYSISVWLEAVLVSGTSIWHVVRVICVQSCVCVQSYVCAELCVCVSRAKCRVMHSTSCHRYLWFRLKLIRLK